MEPKGWKLRRLEGNLRLRLQPSQLALHLASVISASQFFYFFFQFHPFSISLHFLSFHPPPSLPLFIFYLFFSLIHSSHIFTPLHPIPPHSISPHSISSHSISPPSTQPYPTPPHPTPPHPTPLHSTPSPLPTDIRNKDQVEALLSELKVMMHIGSHLNIVNLIGAVTKHVNQGEPHHTTPHHTTPHHTTPHYTTPHHTTPHHTTLHHTTPHHTIPHHTTPHYTTPHHTTPHHTTPHHTTPHHTTPHHTIPHHTTPHHATPHHTTPQEYSM